MKSIDPSIRYYELNMYYPDTASVPEYPLPDGFRFEYFRPGDEDAWVEIQTESGSISSEQHARQYFRDFFGHFYGELSKRCLFITEEADGRKVAAATVSLLKEPEQGFSAAVDWVAIRRSHQGKHLSKPLMTALLKQADMLGHRTLLLHTQTTTYLAASVYLNLGFLPLPEEDITGWRILHTLTEHETLKAFPPLEEAEIYDPLVSAVRDRLTEMFGEDRFTYSVWYKNGRHDVYARTESGPKEYRYQYDGSSVTLTEV